jgi:hypothetical protein
MAWSPRLGRTWDRRSPVPVVVALERLEPAAQFLMLGAEGANRPPGGTKVS